MDFEEFLALVEFDPERAENEYYDYSLYITGQQVERESVNQFKSRSNSPPSLLSLSVAAVFSTLNQRTCDATNAESVREYWSKHIKVLPDLLRYKIKSQCSFATLHCVYQDEVWNEDPVLVASSIKQEEDMLRYLYWKDPTNPLLRHFEQTLLIHPLQGKYFDMLRQPVTPLTSKLMNSTAFEATNQENKISTGEETTHTANWSTFVDEPTFKANWRTFSKGLLEGLDWSNCLVVGGSVLGSLSKSSDYLQNSDIDIYLYNLSQEAALKKVEYIYRLAKSRWPHPVGMTKTANTVTIISTVDWSKPEAHFVNIQIILSTYASPLDILLSSDMNSCSGKSKLICEPLTDFLLQVGYDGEQVIAIPRFMLGMKYRANFLDSSTKFGTKLRWERLTKYYQRGFDIVAPLQLRVHGHGSLTSIDTVAKSHPNTVQLIELMSLLKLRLMCTMRNTKTFGIHRENGFLKWALTWTTGVWKANIGRTAVKDDYAALKAQLPDPPHWVTQHYETHQKLLMSTAVREPPRYSEYIVNLTELYKGDNYKPPTDEAEAETKLREYLDRACKFDHYNDSSLQCFHLNFFVDKDQKRSTNPYCEMNTSLVNLNYRLDTFTLEFDDITDFLSGQVQTLEKRFQMFDRNWKFTLTYCTPLVAFVSLTKEDDVAAVEYNKVGKIAMLGVNLLVIFGDTTFDGSHLFTDEEPHNTWLTWVQRGYLQRNEHDDWSITLQLIEPSFNITQV